MREYGKAIVAVVVAAIVVAYQALSGDGRIEATEWVSVAIAAVTALGVYVVPLAPHARWTKSAVAAILAVLQIATTAILGGLGADEILLMVITAAGALGIYIAPAKSTAPSGAAVAVGTGSDT
jgi:hypothetical protein